MELKKILKLASIIIAAGVSCLKVEDKISITSRDSNSNKCNNLEEKASNDLDEYAKYTRQFEGSRKRVYDPNPYDEKPEPTIGIGHRLNRGDSREIFDEVLPEVNYDKICDSEAELTEEQIKKLFKHDLKTIYIPRARKTINGFDKLPLYLKRALVDMAYRGDLLGSPKTISLMNAGRWEEAGYEYTHRREYREARIKGMSGLKTRIDSNKDRILRYAGEIKNAN